MRADLTRLKRDTDSARRSATNPLGEVESQPWWRGRLAVLPFVNGSADANAEYLSDGITESLINSLSQLPNLKVMSRDSVFRYKGRETEAETLGRELGVRAVLEGRVMQRGDSLTISAELIDASDNSHVWGQQYSRKPSDIFALQERITKEITKALRLRLTGEEEKRLAKSYTTNPEAYQNYLKGLYWLNKRSGETSKAIEYFERAIARDSNFALAYAGLAGCHNQLAVYGVIVPKEAYRSAKLAALKALELDDTIADGHTALAYVKAVSEWDWCGSDREFQQAIALDLKAANAHMLRGVVLSKVGSCDAAIAEVEQALELDPHSISINRIFGSILYESRQFDRAIEQGRNTLDMDPSSTWSHRAIGLSYLQKSMYQEGISEFEKLLHASPNSPFALSDLGSGFALAGQKTEPQRFLAQLTELSKQKYVPPVCSARVFASLGDKDKAFEWLEKSYQDRSIGGWPFIKVDARFDPLRSDPRFADLLRRMNLKP